MGSSHELIGKQNRVVHLASDRHNVVLGTAGTGKSTMAVARAVHLASPTTVNGGPTLLITYNNALIVYLRYLAGRHVSPADPPDLDIETYSAFARKYLVSRGVLDHRSRICDGDQTKAHISAAVGRLRRENTQSPTLRRDLGWFVDELRWIVGMGLRDEQSYQEIRRRGRQTRLGTGQPRGEVWGSLQLYRQLRQREGALFDWYDIASAVRDALATDASKRRYRHIVIDEGQDLTPEMIRSVAESVQPGGSITFFGDYHQAIYGQGMSWRSAGLHLDGRPVERFVDNYRNTIQIARLMTAMTQSKYMSSDDEDLIVPGQSVTRGSVPILVRCQNSDHEAKTVRRWAAEFVRTGSVAVLARTWREAINAVADLPYTKLKTGMSSWRDEPGIYVGTYHSGKGLEFDTVILPHLNDDRIPLPSMLTAFDQDEGCAREARLLYVSMSRARSTLLMTCSGTLTRLMPDNDGRWEEVTRC
ncbi:3'-5' exonuclease [Nocardia brasiliensis]|uniref:3'-5' exonuclease n=1 Tax=Nocardia brasiliensis TaxID=37326 RepID=UPI0024574BB5|nr:3'-5' exonuclease [Nocardia brasiliensis]